MNCINKKCGAELLAGAKYCHICGRKQVKEKHRRVRGNGQGTVYRLPNGKWRAEKTVGWIVDPLPPDAPAGTVPKKRRIPVTDSKFSTKSEALAALPYLTAAQRHPRGGTATARKGEKITLKELYDQWEPTHKKSQSTINCYRSGFRLFAPLWYTPMTDIDIDDLQDCLDDTELGKRTKENARAALGLIYRYGIPRNCIPKDRNLAKHLNINAEGGKGKVGFSEEELEKIRKAAKGGSRMAQIVLCHCYLGFRPTAFLALTLPDYNSEEHAFVGGIKTEAGISRTVTISPKIQPYIDQLIGERTTGTVFCQEDGTAFSLAAYRESFYALLEKLQISNEVGEDGRHRVTPHSCRHTFATLMKNVPGSDTDKLALIGHTSTEQLREYQDVSYADLRRITDQI